MRIIAVAALLWAAGSAAQRPAALVEPQAPARVEQVETEATAVAVDAQRRLVTIQDDRGRAARVTVAPQVMDLRGVRVGDPLRLRYVPATALALATPGTTVAGGPDAVRYPLPGGGETAARIRTVHGRVEEMEPGRRELAVRTAAGELIGVRVPEGMAEFDALKRGDAVTVRMAEAAALAAD